MALNSKKEFAQRCGITTRALATYAKRRKVVVNELGMVDDSLQQNILFLQKHQVKKKPVEKTPAPDPAPKVPGEAMEIMNLERKKKTIEVELLTEKMEKMRGKLLPTDLVGVMVAQVFREFTVSLKQSMEIMLTDVAKKAKLNGNQLAEIRGVMVKAINHGVNRGTDNAQKNVKNIVAEYSVNKTA